MVETLLKVNRWLAQGSGLPGSGRAMSRVRSTDTLASVVCWPGLKLALISRVYRARLLTKLLKDKRNLSPKTK